ncbi:hypothetical protein CTP10_R45940 [Cupriavidus sp. P-10]|uniref:hypothetical protein n=1 Tax=Cupriavidus sp. P-10 TaxID=2027911 RepID=UPI000ED6E1BF|nr:hypothetical protein [Cupriavidus sp. P-10]BDB27189.1 hypothetical protein CTP10_R45940 [Cupriavidus sp. P-10]
MAAPLAGKTCSGQPPSQFDDIPIKTFLLAMLAPGAIAVSLPASAGPDWTVIERRHRPAMRPPAHKTPARRPRQLRRLRHAERY